MKRSIGCLSRSGTAPTLLHTPLRKPGIGGVWADATPVLSPYLTNPFAMAPLAQALQGVVDVEALRSAGAPALYVTARHCRRALTIAGRAAGRAAVRRPAFTAAVARVRHHCCGGSSGARSAGSSRAMRAMPRATRSPPGARTRPIPDRRSIAATAKGAQCALRFVQSARPFAAAIHACPWPCDRRPGRGFRPAVPEWARRTGTPSAMTGAKPPPSCRLPRRHREHREPA